MGRASSGWRAARQTQVAPVSLGSPRPYFLDRRRVEGDHWSLVDWASWRVLPASRDLPLRARSPVVSTAARSAVSHPHLRPARLPRRRVGARRRDCPCLPPSPHPLPSARGQPVPQARWCSGVCQMSCLRQRSKQRCQTPRPAPEMRRMSRKKRCDFSKMPCGGKLSARPRRRQCCNGDEKVGVCGARLGLPASGLQAEAAEISVCICAAAGPRELQLSLPALFAAERHSATPHDARRDTSSTTRSPAMQASLRALTLNPRSQSVRRRPARGYETPRSAPFTNRYPLRQSVGGYYASGRY
jgi:hypothetical protein